MRSIPLSEAKGNLVGLMDEVENEKEIFEITRGGRPVVVLMSMDAHDSLHETLFWLSQPGARDDIGAALRQLTSGKTLDADTTRAQHGLPPL
ncbi:MULTISPECIES: type II toxin-antitoxin system Phd/YefM family antitoxin [unclassified Microbacterium]|uniref:type II toxin-antitoxin system Phd/YefM family antitoxin n=1 Tax=unclassified Microbacterium TaxID=2609290 RepID=UPI000EA9B5D9|nr:MULTISPECIES: type II toxin-antitoxin system Phd/YefM family antitoxin [unclassified Microbacterium]MBT2485902.1 type II toxin-antitoxin system Phd/YefM family antitoxin [Microbacterium sp. ISL-108]RKN68657.1 type II toxin-antitoxin system Phd/YefM family antitoxin [Microbacterium sp. CGR2]